MDLLFAFGLFLRARCAHVAFAFFAFLSLSWVGVCVFRADSVAVTLVVSHVAFVHGLFRVVCFRLCACCSLVFCVGFGCACLCARVVCRLRVVPVRVLQFCRSMCYFGALWVSQEASTFLDRFDAFDSVHTVSCHDNSAALIGGTSPESFKFCVCVLNLLCAARFWFKVALFVFLMRVRVFYCFYIFCKTCFAA